ncbi:MAG: DMT family transporter [Mycobacteriales bacterium]
MTGGRLERAPAPLLVLVAITSVQCGSALARGLFGDLGAAGITLLRLGLAALLLFTVLRPAVRSWPGPAWRAAALLGLVMAGMNLAFYLAIRTVPLGVAVTVEFVGPLLLALAQTRRAVDLLWAVLAGGGVVLLGVDTTSGIPLSGLALALLAGMFWGGYILASAHVGRTLPGTDGLAVALAVATLVVLPFGASGAAAVLHRPALLLPAVGVAILSSVLSYGLELSALRRIPTRVFGILMSLEPAAAAVAGRVLLSQRLQLREAAALLMVSGASAGVTLARREGAVPAQPLE